MAEPAPAPAPAPAAAPAAAAPAPAGAPRERAPRGEAGFGRGRGRGRGRGGRGGRGRGKDEEKAVWVPCTKLGRLVKEGKIKSLEQIYFFSMPVKEVQIIDFFLGPKLKDEVLKITPVQKQTQAGQRTRFKAHVVVGDMDGHIGLGAKVAKEVATAIRCGIVLAKLALVPVRRGFWGQKFGKPHTVPCKLTGKCGSVSVRLIPAPRGSGLIAGPIPKKLLNYAGVEDCFTSKRGHTKTLGNFAIATFNAISKSYGFLTPDLWAVHKPGKIPFQEHTDFLAKTKIEH